MLNRFQLLLLASIAQSVRYEGEGEGEGGGDAGAGGGNGGQGAGTPKTFTQDELNKFLAEDRRKHRAQMEKVEQQLAQLSSAQMSDAERQELNATLEDVRKQLLSKEQKAALEKAEIEKAYKTKLTEAETKAREWEARYTSSTIDRALMDAASSGDAFNANQVVNLLRANTKMVEGKPMVDFEDRHAETGEPIMTQLSPADAVKRMKELSNVYGNLFKSYVVNGIGGSGKSDGSYNSGPVDVSKLTPEQYRKLRKENPSALGM